MTPEAAVTLAATRGRLMGREAALHPGGMVAIVASTRDAVHDAIAIAGRHGSVQLAAHNAPDEWVLSGDHPALQAIPAAFSPTPLSTAGPWHSTAMIGAVAEYREAVEAAVSARPAASLIANNTGRTLAANDELVELLARQLTHPVLWSETMTTIGRGNGTVVMSVGPGKALRGLARRCLGREATIVGVDDPSMLDRIARMAAA
jgi:[acyl-carrier-protein] S-malonyltransferase